MGLSMINTKVEYILLVFAFFACEKFAYSPNQVLPDEKYRNLNEKSISQFINKITDTIVIAVIGDTHNFYDATSNVITKINKIPGIHFVIHTGDLVNFGLEKEYIWMHELLLNLKPPYVVVAGNHDLIGNGSQLYKTIYGKFNFSFIFNEYKFIYLNSNSREFNFSNNVPDIDWLNTELEDTVNYKHAIVVNHVPSYDSDFNPNLADDYLNTLDRFGKVLLSINGHNHNFSFISPDERNFSFINSISTLKERFVLIKIWDNRFSYKIID